MIKREIIDQIRDAGAHLTAELICQKTGQRPRFSGRKVQLKCCFHDDQSPSLTIYPDGGYHCHAASCRAHGKDVFDYLQKTDNMSFIEAVKFVAERTNLSHLIKD